MSADWWRVLNDELGRIHPWMVVFDGRWGCLTEEGVCLFHRSTAFWNTIITTIFLILWWYYEIRRFLHIMALNGFHQKAVSERFKVILIAHSFFFSLQLKSLHDQWLLLINTYHIDSLRIVRGDITSMVDVRAWCDQSELGFEITWLVVMILTLFRVYVLMKSSYTSIDNYKNVAESGIKHSSFLGINCDIRVHDCHGSIAFPYRYNRA